MPRYLRLSFSTAHTRGLFVVIPGECLKSETAWRRGMDSNFRYRGWKVLNLFPYERSCAHPPVWSFVQRLQPAQLSFIDLLDGVIRLGLWHVWVLLALGLRLSQLLIVTQNSRRPVGEREH